MTNLEKEMIEITKLFNITTSFTKDECQLFWVSGPGLLHSQLTTTHFFAEELQGQFARAFLLGLRFGKTTKRPFRAMPAVCGYKVDALGLCIPFSGMEGAEIWSRIFNDVYEAGSKSVC